VGVQNPSLARPSFQQIDAATEESLLHGQHAADEAAGQPQSRIEQDAPVIGESVAQAASVGAARLSVLASSPAPNQSRRRRLLTKRNAASAGQTILQGGPREVEMDAKTLQEIVEIQVERLSGGAPICATVFEGVVTLTGAVQNDARRVLIEQELLHLPEVLDVHNHLHVATPAGDLRTQLLALLDREGVAMAGAKIEVRDGTIVLSGQAANWFDRDAIERLAWTLPGVRSVENRVALPPGAVEPDGEGAEVSQI